MQNFKSAAEQHTAFMKELSDALLKVRPLGGSELFVKRFGSYYADPKYCGAAIEEAHKSRHETMCENARLRKAISEIEALSDNCINAERYTTADALGDLQAIRSAIKRLRAKLPAHG
jgi:hypothetical protein